jgi:hypothetical protein
LYRKNNFSVRIVSVQGRRDFLRKASIFIGPGPSPKTRSLSSSAWLFATLSPGRSCCIPDGLEQLASQLNLPDSDLT